MDELKKLEGKRQADIEAKMVEVPTQLTKMIQLENGDIVNELDLLLMMYNDIQLIKRATA